jgi:hypothetical protein
MDHFVLEGRSELPPWELSPEVAAEAPVDEG